MDSKIINLFQSPPTERSRLVEAHLTDIFKKAGWSVSTQRHSDTAPDMLIERNGIKYAIQIKIVSEARGDRVLPIWSQAYLETKYAAKNDQNPLPIILAPRIGRNLAMQLLDHAAKYAPDAAIGVLDTQGLRIFRGSGLDGLDSEAAQNRKLPAGKSPTPVNLFSDLNQWMLKVLLAAELPENLLTAPRDNYRNASDLSKSAKVSVMTAFRFIEQLDQENYLDRSAAGLKLVRRRSLFERWQSASRITALEIPIRYILRRTPEKEIERILFSNTCCLGLFAAADKLNVGFVKGVPPIIYVPKLTEECLMSIGNIRPAEKHEQADVILRQSATPKSVFRGLVKVGKIPVSDILQIWLDTSSHPTRGSEQAEFIHRTVLKDIF